MGGNAGSASQLGLALLPDGLIFRAKGFHLGIEASKPFEQVVLDRRDGRGCGIIGISLSDWIDLLVAWVRAGARKSQPSPRLAFMVPRIMAKTIVVPKKKRGPAPTGKGTQVQVRLQPSQLAALDGWIAKQSPPVTRPEAIRAILATILRKRGTWL